ncbi:MAG: hypothetical protein KF803_01995 [Cyclobacteriaceae bacterium]|nr:hypothetical protein [Cyclobacteriaceae bacterium]
MENKLKEHLLKIANKVTDNTSLEDVYQQLSLLADIEESEKEEAAGQTLTHEEVVSKSGEWLK